MPGLTNHPKTARLRHFVCMVFSSPTTTGKRSLAVLVRTLHCPSCNLKIKSNLMSRSPNARSRLNHYSTCRCRAGNLRLHHSSAIKSHLISDQPSLRSRFIATAKKAIDISKSVHTTKATRWNPDNCKNAIAQATNAVTTISVKSENFID